LATIALVLGVVGGVGLGAWSTTKNHFTPSNLENPLQESGKREEQIPDSLKVKPFPRAVVVNGERFNFGSMRRSAEMSHTFYIRNTGTAPLTIEQRETTCKCTISKLEKNEIPPNQTAAVTLEWKAKNAEESFRQAAIIATNDPEREFIQLRIEGLVEDTIRMSPASIQFINLSASETATREFRILGSKSLEELEVTEWELTQKRTAEFFDVQMRELTAEEVAQEKEVSRGILVSVTIKPGLPTGDIEQTIRIKTNMPEAPDFYVEVGGNIIGDISIMGPKYDSHRGILVMGGVDHDTGAETQLLILVKGPDRDNVRLQVADIDPANGLEATLGERKENERSVTYLLKVRVPKNAPRMSRLGTDQGKLGRILLTTENSVIKEIPIRVKFSVN